MNDPNPSLYDRVGGADGVERLIDAFYTEVLADAQLAPFFRDAEVPKLKAMQREFFAAALDGPSSYTGRPLAHAHHGRGIKPSHIGAFVHHLFTTLEGFDLTEAERDAIIARINTYADEITGGAGLDG